MSYDYEKDEEAYRKANDYDYQEHLIRMAKGTDIRGKYLSLQSKKYEDRDCSFCNACIGFTDHKRTNKQTCDKIIKQKVDLFC